MSHYRSPKQPPSSASAPDTALTGESPGRINQKRRTQRALFDAAIALSEEGRKPTFAEVAERAMVSRATAYRYFNSVEALISEAMFERAVRSPEESLAPGADPAEAIASRAREFNRVLLADEVGTHVMERSFMAVWLENDAASRPPRPARRMKHIGVVTDSLKDELPAAARKRLAQALAMVMGPEAVVALRDVAGASAQEALAASAWAAQALVKQARAESAEARKARTAPTRLRSSRR
jgi:AcrR family transcriptional regulator